MTSFADYTGTPGMVMSLFGAALALAAALQVGHYSFMGQPQVPRKLETGGVYALLRHPQALGNMLFLIGGWVAGWPAKWGRWEKGLITRSGCQPACPARCFAQQDPRRTACQHNC